jgi:hypothetical protein
MTSLAESMPRRQSWAEPLPLPPADDDLARLHAVWQEQCGDAATPDHAQIRAEAFAFILGRVNVIDVNSREPRYTFRIYGTQIGRYREDTHHSWRSTEPIRPLQYRALIEGHYAEAHATQAPTLHEVYMTNGAIVRKYRRLIVPYATASDPAGILVTGTVFPESIKDVVQSPAFLRDEE